MPQTLLFTAQNVTDFLREEISNEQAAIAERVVWGWLKPVLQLTDRPDVVSAELFSWAVELGAIAVKNPGGLAEHQVEGERTKYSLERRQELLTLAGSGGVDTGGTATPEPAGQFPATVRYPDPAERPCW